MCVDLYTCMYVNMYVHRVHKNSCHKSSCHHKSSCQNINVGLPKSLNLENLVYSPHPPKQASQVIPSKHLCRPM